MFGLVLLALAGVERCGCAAVVDNGRAWYETAAEVLLGYDISAAGRSMVNLGSEWTDRECSDDTEATRCLRLAIAARPAAVSLRKLAMVVEII
jgi:hypothetical protein